MQNNPIVIKCILKILTPTCVSISLICLTLMFSKDLLVYKKNEHLCRTLFCKMHPWFSNLFVLASLFFLKNVIVWCLQQLHWSAWLNNRLYVQSQSQYLGAIYIAWIRTLFRRFKFRRHSFWYLFFAVIE